MGDTKIPAGCKVGALYQGGFFTKGQKEADTCAAALTKNTGKVHGVTSFTENISDGLPARVLVTYYKVIAGKK